MFSHSWQIWTNFHGRFCLCIYVFQNRYFTDLDSLLTHIMNRISSHISIDFGPIWNIDSVCLVLHRFVYLNTGASQIVQIHSCGFEHTFLCIWTQVDRFGHISNTDSVYLVFTQVLEHSFFHTGYWRQIFPTLVFHKVLKTLFSHRFSKTNSNTGFFHIVLKTEFCTGF